LGFKGAKIRYAEEEIEGELFFKTHPLLSEKGITHQDIKVTRWNDLPIFFQVEGNSAWPFDPFALSFYLVTRYEEYVPFKADEHGRFRPGLSLAYREGFLEIPLVDAIAHKLKNLLKERFRQRTFPAGHSASCRHLISI
jgi:hypothetical protein